MLYFRQVENLLISQTEGKIGVLYHFLNQEGRS